MSETSLGVRSVLAIPDDHLCGENPDNSFPRSQRHPCSSLLISASFETENNFSSLRAVKCSWIALPDWLPRTAHSCGGRLECVLITGGVVPCAGDCLLSFLLPLSVGQTHIFCHGILWCLLVGATKALQTPSSPPPPRVFYPGTWQASESSPSTPACAVLLELTLVL